MQSSHYQLARFACHVDIVILYTTLQFWYPIRSRGLMKPPNVLSEVRLIIFQLYTKNSVVIYHFKMLKYF